MRELSPLTEAVVTDNVADAVRKVREEAQHSSQRIGVLVTGSLHLVGALLRTLEPDAED
jgi:folylpolyglutamate synthase